MKQKKSKARVPKLRFPKFRNAGEWEEKKLGDISTRIIEKVGTLSLTPVSITSVSGFVSQVEKFGRDISGEQYKNYIKLNKGEFAYNKGYSKTFPQGSIYKLKEFEQVAAPNAFICFRFKENFVADFFQNYFAKNVHGEQLKKYITSGARSDGLLNINPADFFTIKFLTPDKLEQQKIADCLFSLDELISANTQKLDKLKTYKKGLMQNLFPAEGETVPKLRFREFKKAGEWEEKTLESFCKIGDLDYKMPSSVANGIPYIMTGDFFGINNIDFDNAKKISTEDYEQLSKKIKPEFGDIIIARYASVGAVRYIEIKIKFLVSYSCAIIKCNKSENSKYLYYSLQSDSIQSKIGLEINMSSQKNIGIDSIKKLNIFLPTVPEQLKIADCLSSLDEKILGQSKKVESLKEHKKGLMQQLFPAGEK